MTSSSRPPLSAASTAASGVTVSAVMLAYVFWHWPVRQDGYEEALLAFHGALATHPFEGFRGSRAARIGPRPWLVVPRAYEDWYFVDDFAALGALNEAAISGPRAAVHAAVAALAAGGTAALYGLVSGTATRPRHAAFRTKPSGVTYAAYSTTMPEGLQVWQRKMVLGPSPEFCILSDHPLEDSMPGEPLYPGSDDASRWAHWP
jgi:hypothetical protein